MLVGFSMGTGEVTRYLGTHGSARVRKVSEDIKAAVAQERAALALTDAVTRIGDAGVLDAVCEEAREVVTGETADVLMGMSGTAPGTRAAAPRRGSGGTPRTGRTCDAPAGS